MFNPKKFNSKKWIPWLEAKALELKTDNTKIEISFSSEDKVRPGLKFLITGNRVIGEFQAWNYGEAFLSFSSVPVDPIIGDCGSKSSYKVSDENFESLFENFIKRFTKSNLYTGPESVGEGEIENTFIISGRGFVLVIKDGWQGKIPRQGFVSNDELTIFFNGPDFLRMEGGKEKIVVTVGEELKDAFKAGQRVKFFKLGRN